MNRSFVHFAVVSAFFFIAAGCTKYYPASAFLDLSVAPQRGGIYDGTLSANIFGTDKREIRALIHYAFGGDEDLRIPAADAPQVVVARGLAEGFGAQGLVIDENGRMDIGVEITAMTVRVTKDFWKYEATAKTQLVVSISRSAKSGAISLRLSITLLPASPSISCSFSQPLA